MADYKISLGAEVRTSEINKQVNNYKGDIKIGAILDTSGITAELNSYRPPKPIEVKSKLNTEGIKNAIQNYKTDRLRAIMATSDLDTTGIDNKIAAYNQAPKTITIDTTLDEKSITRQINAYNKSGQAPTITVSAELSDNAIGDAIKKFDTSNQLIKINVQPVFDGFDAADAEKLLDGYTARVPLKVNLELNKTHINQQITDYNATALSDNGRTITLKAKLTDTAVADAISNYKTSNADKLKIPVDLTFSKDSKAELNAFDAELQKRIASYEGTPVDIPVRLKPANGKSFTSQITKLPVYIDAVLKNADDINNALNVYENSPVPVAAKLVPGKNFASDITKTPIKVEAEIIPDSINKALTNPAKPFNKIPIGVTLTLKDTNDINKQVKQLAPFATEMLNLDVKLNYESVNAAIAKSKPATPLDVNIKLIDDDINKQIEAIHPTSQIKVNVKVNDGDVDEKTGKQKAQESILVNVQLDHDDINRQIEAIRPTSKIKVGVQLDFATHKDKDTKEVIQKGIAQQIKEYETKSKVKVGVELDEDSVNTSVRNFKTDVPIKLGVELDTEPAEKRIEELKAEFKKFGNITINFAGSGGGSSVGDGNGSGGSAQNVAQQFREVDIQIESTHDQVENFKNALSNIGFNTNSIDAITKEFENLEISVRNVTSRLRDDGSTTLTIKGLDKFGRTVKSMRSIDEKGNVTNLGTTISQDFKETENAFKRLKSLGKEISKLDIKIAGLDADKNKQEIAELIAQLNKLEAEYNDLFDITENNLSASQIDELAQDIASGSSKVAATKARVADKAAAQKAKEEAKEINDAYISIYNTKKRIGDLEVELIGAEAKGDAETVKSINDEITRLKNNLSTLDKDGAYSSRFTDEQNSTLNELNEYTQYRKNHAKSQIADKTALKETENAFKRLKELGKEISQLDIEIAKLDPDKDIAEIDKLTARLKKLEAEYDSLFDSTETNLTGGQIDELLRDIENGGDKLDILKAKLKDAKTALATKIDINLNDGTVAKQVKNVTSEFDKIKNKLPELQIAMDGFNEALAKLNIAKDYEGEDRVEKLIAAYQEYERALKAVKNQLDINKTAEKDAAAKAKLEDDRLAFQSKIDAWLTKNSAAAKLFGDDLLELRKQAESCDRVKLDHLEREFKRIDTEAEAAGKKMKTFPDRIKEQFQKYSSYFSIASVFMYAEQAMRSMFEQVKLIDSAMTELKKVTNETDASYNNFLGNAASRAKELGTTIDGLVASTADFARLGYGFQESQKLAEVANIYAVVGDEIEGVEDATQSLVSTMAAFKNDMNGMSNDDFAMSIVDKMNEVSNNFAISSGGIGQALQRSASSMAAANNTLDETIAMITAANEVAQNPEKVGNAMKTMSMRIRGAKTELEEAGESTDGMAESTASLRAEIKALSGVDIMLDANTFKSTYQIMDELSRKWENLSDIQQATIIELVAGRVFARIYRNVYKEYI